jgi:hypothetical protein
MKHEASAECCKTGRIPVVNVKKSGSKKLPKLTFKMLSFMSTLNLAKSFFE